MHTLKSPRLAEAYCDRQYALAQQEGRLQKAGSAQLQRAGSRASDLPTGPAVQLQRQGSRPGSSSVATQTR